MLYCHIPDIATAFEETAAALHELWSRGCYREFCSACLQRLYVTIARLFYYKLGLSNYSMGQTEEFLSECDKCGWLKPFVYQGQYNALYRKMERFLLPLLKRRGMNYVAFRQVP